jgi:putative AlgH/UPF0301 family transcriptional regulator
LLGRGHHHHLVHGDLFAQTVALLLHYDENGAMGIVVNRPTEIEPEELLAEVDIGTSCRYRTNMSLQKIRAHSGND